jgi:hypothetical protein
MEEQVGTSGEASVQGLAWPSRLQLNRLHGVTSQKMILFITTVVKTSNPTFLCSDSPWFPYFSLSIEAQFETWRLCLEHFRFRPCLVSLPTWESYVSIYLDVISGGSTRSFYINAEQKQLSKGPVFNHIRGGSKSCL